MTGIVGLTFSTGPAAAGAELSAMLAAVQDYGAYNVDLRVASKLLPPVAVLHIRDGLCMSNRYWHGSMSGYYQPRSRIEYRDTPLHLI